MSDEKIAPRFPHVPRMQAFAKLHKNYAVDSAEFKQDFLQLWNEFLSELNN